MWSMWCDPISSKFRNIWEVSEKGKTEPIMNISVEDVNIVKWFPSKMFPSHSFLPLPGGPTTNFQPLGLEWEKKLIPFYIIIGSEAPISTKSHNFNVEGQFLESN